MEGTVSRKKRGGETDFKKGGQTGSKEGYLKNGGRGGGRNPLTNYGKVTRT